MAPPSNRDAAGFRSPPPQQNYEEAARLALAAIRGQPAEQLQWLGAGRTGDDLFLPVLADRLTVELETGTVSTSAGKSVGPFWRTLTLHYLAVAGRPDDQPPAVTFAGLTGATAYAPVYQQRVVDRLCRTAGRDRSSLLKAGQTIGGRPVNAGDVGLDFQVYPRVRVRLVWYAGDDEFPPAATLLLPGNIESFFCLEDITVLSEGLVSSLSGKRF